MAPASDRRLRVKRGADVDAHNRNWSPAAVLFLVTLLLYGRALGFGFIWDDDTHLTKNIVIEPGGLRRSWFSAEQPNYWPLTWTAFWLQWKLVGLKPLLFHLVNVALHGANAVLVWRVLRRLALPGAWLAALVFAVHPVNVETAAWVTQLKTLLSMCSYLGALLLWLRSEEGGGSRRGYWGAVALFVAAMLSKPAPVTMPFVMLLISWWREGRISRRAVLQSLPFFAVAGVLSITEIWFQYNVSIHKDVVRTDGLAARLAGAGWVVLFYASKVLAPVGLTFVYPRWDIRATNLIHWIPLVVVVAVVVVGWIKRRGWGRAVLFGFGYFVVTLLPVMGFLNIYYFRYSFVADHWQYVSMPGLVALVVCGSAWWVENRQPGLLRAWRGAVAVACVFLAVMSLHQQRIYASPEALWNDTLRKNPKAWIAHQQLGVLAAERGDFTAADRHFVDTLTAKPDHAEALFNRANAMAAAGKSELAVEQFRKAIRMKPDYVEAHNNLGLALVQLGRIDEAIAHYEAATRIQPFADAETNWGLALASQKKFDEAIRHYARAVEINKTSEEARLNWGAALMEQGKAAEAMFQFREAIRANPSSAFAHHNLAYALEKSGKLNEAIQHYEAAARLEPGNPRRHENLARARQRSKASSAMR